MQPFTIHQGKAVVLDWTDVNTDLIIPARYLKRVERVGYGPLLFADKRYVAGGSPRADDPESHGPLDPVFPLNRPEAEGATILVVGKNFGCGSSREHAVWAVAQAGFRALIAPGKGRRVRRHLRGERLRQRPRPPGSPRRGMGRDRFRRPRRGGTELRPPRPPPDRPPGRRRGGEFLRDRHPRRPEAPPGPRPRRHRRDPARRARHPRPRTKRPRLDHAPAGVIGEDNGSRLDNR